MTPPILRVGTYNLYEYGRHSDDDAKQRHEQVAAVLAALDCDVVAVQEVCGGDDALEHLAELTGMSCWCDAPYPDEKSVYSGRVALTGTQVSDFHVGLLWRSDTARPVSDGFHTHPGGGEFWHGVAIQSFQVEGLNRPLHVGSYHGTPFQQDARPDEARRIVSVLTRPYGDSRLAIIGADWNSVSADRVQNDDTAWHYWHSDPYWRESEANVWREPYGYQCRVDSDGPDGLPTRWCADRRPGEVLLRAGCRDTAVCADAEWAPSVGHHPHADMPPRCIDTHRVSPALTPTVVGWEVVTDIVDGSDPKKASDHLPVVTTLDMSRVK